jgi:hypothetical protein
MKKHGFSMGSKPKAVEGKAWHDSMLEKKTEKAKAWQADSMSPG